MRKINLTRPHEAYEGFLDGATFTHYNDSDKEIFFTSYDVIYEEGGYLEQKLSYGVLTLEDAQRLASWIDEIF